MDMSLDDYIAFLKKPDTNSTNGGGVRSIANQEGSFKAERHRHEADDEDEDMDEEMNLGSGSGGMNRSTNDSVTDKVCNTKRINLKSDGHDSDNLQINQVRGREKVSSKSGNHSRDLPSLLSLDFSHLQQGNWLKKQNRRYTHDRRYFNRNSNGYDNSIGFPSNRDPRCQPYGGSQGRPNNARGLMVQCDREVWSGCVNRRVHSVSQGPARCGSIEPKVQMNMSSFQNRMPTTSAGVAANGYLTNAARTALTLRNNNDANSVSNQQLLPSHNDSLRNFLGFQGNLSSEMMPVFAARLLNFLQNNCQSTVHKPIYDMKIQKEIHEIQKRPLMYRCPGGEIVSSDGAGINCEIVPHTSDVSMNCRFA